MKRIASFAAIAPFPCAPRAEADIATDATNFRGDLHKVPTATASVEIYGIKLKSRYGKLSELQAMVSVLDHLSVLTVDALDAMQCDSKEGSSVLISLRKNVPEAELKLIAKELSRWFEWATGDPKYIAVECPNGMRCDLNPFSMCDDEPTITQTARARAQTARARM